VEWRNFASDDPGKMASNSLLLIIPMVLDFILVDDQTVLYASTLGGTIYVWPPLISTAQELLPVALWAGKGGLYVICREKI